jgi:hypothetical protein
MPVGELIERFGDELPLWEAYFATLAKEST